MHPERKNIGPKWLHLSIASPPTMAYVPSGSEALLTSHSESASFSPLRRILRSLRHGSARRKMPWQMHHPATTGLLTLTFALIGRTHHPRPYAYVIHGFSKCASHQYALLLWAGLSAATRRSYDAPVKSYETFCATRNLKHGQRLSRHSVSGLPLELLAPRRSINNN